MIATSELRTKAARFTLDGDQSLERHLEVACARAASGICGLIPPRKLEAILLGGGYGRGEGGVRRELAGDRPYNDLELYVAVRGNRHWNEFRYGRRLEVLAGILTHLAGIEVEFKITSLKELRESPVSMFSYDLLVGHRRLATSRGAQAITGCDHHLRAEDLPAAEATRLLMNRCSGLLLARAELNKMPLTLGAADFASRNISKAQLACGDAFLAAHGLYHWSCRERHQRLETLAEGGLPPWIGEVVRHHAAGVEFKLHPSFAPLAAAELESLYQEVAELSLKCWRFLEESRLGIHFDSAKDYATCSVDKWPNSSPTRNAILNLRTGLGPKSRFFFRRHPRNRVVNALALLLWEPTVLSDSNLRSVLYSNLNAKPENFGEAVGSYKRLWARVR